MANEADQAKADKPKGKAEPTRKTEAEAKADKAAARAAKSELQVHVVTRNVLHDGDLVSAGDDIAITRAQHAQLFAVGAVEEPWAD